MPLDRPDHPHPPSLLPCRCFGATMLLWCCPFEATQAAPLSLPRSSHFHRKLPPPKPIFAECLYDISVEAVCRPRRCRHTLVIGIAKL
ncbi:hypothetical protein BT93_D0085 [Corymbia citriodora subsp. variegata]|nr:hypothetical protein BT93_D0085 [Corymbia citriodora subsp. variegata]